MQKCGQLRALAFDVDFGSIWNAQYSLLALSLWESMKYLKPIYTNFGFVCRMLLQEISCLCEALVFDHVFSRSPARSIDENYMVCKVKHLLCEPRNFCTNFSSEPRPAIEDVERAATAAQRHECHAEAASGGGI